MDTVSELQDRDVVRYSELILHNKDLIYHRQRMWQWTKRCATGGIIQLLKILWALPSAFPHGVQG